MEALYYIYFKNLIRFLLKKIKKIIPIFLLKESFIMRYLFSFELKCFLVARKFAKLFNDYFNELKLLLNS